MDEITDRFFDLAKSGTKAAILMSGMGSNADALLKKRLEYPSLEICCIVSNNPKSRADFLGDKHALPYEILSAQSGRSFERATYFSSVSQALLHYEVKVLLYAGWMLVAPDFFCQAFPGVNMHPADLTVVGEDGQPRFTGMNAIRKTVESGLPYIASSLHVVSPRVDCGRVVAVSRPLWLSQIQYVDVKELHQQIKLMCEHPLYPKALKLISKGAINVKSLPYRDTDAKGETI